MSPLAIFFVLLNALALLVLPKRWAPVPFLIGACYMTLGQHADLGPFSFSTVRMLIVAGVVRVIMRGERLAGGLNGLDCIMLLWAGWGVISSAFHTTTSEGNPLTFRLGLVYNVLGIYFLFRVFVQGLEDVVHLLKVTACVLAPVGLEMLQERITGRNLFAIFGGVSEHVMIRNGGLRSQGPFAHPILAGTVGAVCFPMMVGFYKLHAWAAALGGVACVIMVITSGSSGPLMSLIFGIFALTLWRWRHLTREMRIGFVISYILLEVVMKAPAYYLIARIDLTGSSTGWHRARLIEMGIAHLGEWWLGGTDHTRHWMPTGVSWSPEHTDITNYFLKMGVIGGLPLMLLFMGALGVAFRYVGQCLRAAEEGSWEDQFFIWALGAALLGQAATCISVSFFDQSYMFLFMNLALISSLWAAQNRTASEQSIEEEDQQESEEFANPLNAWRRCS